MKKRKIYIGIIAIVISIIGMITVNICGVATQKVKYTFELADGVELKSVYINDNNISLKKLKEYQNNDNLIIDEEKNVLVANGKQTITIETSVVDSIYTEFVNDENGNVIVRKNEIIQESSQDTYFYKISILDLFLESLNGYSILWFFILLPLMYISVYFIYDFFNKVKNEDIIVRDILTFALSVFLIFLSTFYFILSVSEILVMVIIVAIFIAGIYALREDIKNNLQNVYVFFAIVMGVAMIFLIPPFNVPDESSHFCKSFVMSYFKNEDDGGYTKLPGFVKEFSDKYLHSVHKVGIEYSGVNYYSDIYLDCDYEDYSEAADINYTNTKYLNFLAYLPSTLVIFICRNLGFSPLLLLLISRFVNLIVAIIGAYFAIKITPKFKRIFFVVCLFPILLQQSAAINQDYLTNVVSIFFIAYVLKCKYSVNAMEKKDKIILLVTTLVLAFCKFGYFPVTLTLFLIPNEKFKNKKEALTLKIVTVIAMIIISYLVSGATASSIDGQMGEYYSLKYVFSHPFDTIKIYFNTMLIRLQSDVLLSLFDGFLYSTVAHKATLSLILTLCYLCLIFTNDEDDVKLTKKERIMFILPAIMIFGIVYSVAFIGWTTFGSRTIWGIQSRYFIPAVLLLYIGISGNLIQIKCKNKNMIYCGTMILVYAITIFTIITSVYK